ncbi:hypothetical protein PENSPDRAFT_653984 [Peniophora sp. CONT]|nr:hypothetical protein PENSPDRAFT_653984 [Peniophora sp. CONT]
MALDAAVGDGFGGSSSMRAITRASHMTWIAELVIPAACTFLLLYMIWMQSFVLRPMSRASGTVIVVDVLGEIFVLDEDTFSTWENTHAFLLQAFRGRLGAPYVENRDYCLGDTQHLLIDPGRWTQIVRPGAKLKMSIIIRKQAPRCPYCQAVTSGRECDSGDGRIICSQCKRPYGTYKGKGDFVHKDSWDEYNTRSATPLSLVPLTVQSLQHTKRPSCKLRSRSRSRRSSC